MRSHRLWLVAGLCCLSVVTSLLWVQAQPAGQKYALLIAVREYDKNQLRNLPFTENDVTVLADLLKKQGYDRVVLMTQKVGADQARFLPLADNIRKSITGILADRAANDTVLIAFAGHGVQFKRDEEHYFCPMDAKLQDRKTLVSLAEVYKQLENSKAGFKFLLADACRNDPQSDASRARAEVDLESVTRPQGKTPPGGVAAFFSCSSGEKSFENTSTKHGVFFEHIIRGLKGEADFDRNGQIDLDELVLFAKRKVPDFVKDEFGDDVRQMPELVGKTRGAVVLASVRPNDSNPPVPVDKTLTLDLGGGVKLELVRIPKGTFKMGSPAGEEDRRDDEKQHEVEITKDFFIGKYEVTQEQYEAVMGTNPSWFSRTGDGKDRVRGLDTRKFPVESVSWEDAVEFCKKVSQKTGKKVQLPTEAQWEYACRAGTKTVFHFGDVLNGKEANCDGTSPYGTSTKGPNLERTCEVGSYRPNSFGLYDMHGNVWEWCQDWYDGYSENSPRQDPQGGQNGALRVLRGGSWSFEPWRCRSALRLRDTPDVRYSGGGFRVCVYP
jgi:formylglycine-generating enzyme required for sulfatase activity